MQSINPSPAPPVLPPLEETRTNLLALLRQQSLFKGDFTLASGAQSSYYVDCKLTTLDPHGAWWAGQLVWNLIRKSESQLGVRIDAAGGLTMGADPIALAAAMVSVWAGESPCLRAFAVRKTAKQHGQGKRLEGGFQPGDSVAVIDDVITRGDSTINAIHAITAEKGKVAFVVALVDRQEGGRQNIENLGHQVFPIFTRDELLRSH